MSNACAREAEIQGTCFKRKSISPTPQWSATKTGWNTTFVGFKTYNLPRGKGCRQHIFGPTKQKNTGADVVLSSSIGGHFGGLGERVRRKPRKRRGG